MTHAASSGSSVRRHASTERVPERRERGGGRSISRKFSPYRRFFLVFLVLGGAVVFSPSLRSAYLLDDYLHASMIAGAYPAPRGPFDLYNFVSDADRDVLVERGMLPWWSDPRLTIRFFRPLSSALVWAEHRALGDAGGGRRATLLLHLHSLAWWAAVVLAARALFRRLLAPRPAWIATVVYALAPCHALPLAWLANREVLVSLAFGIPALGAYLRWRETWRLRDGALAALLFGLSMLGGEYALCLAGYVIAIEIGARRVVTTGDAAQSPESLDLGERIVGLLPFAVPAAAYLLVRRALHYGTLGSGFYTDPFREPVSFVLSAPRRITTLLLSAWFSLDHETLGPDTPWWVIALAGIGGAALLVRPLRGVVARLDEPQRRAAAWLLPGSVLALGPVLAVVPSPRLLGAAMLGVSAAVAWLLDHVWYPGSPPGSPPGSHTMGSANSDASGPVGAVGDRGAALAGFAALVVGFAQLVHGPATSWLVGRHFERSAAAFAEHAASLRARLDDPASAEVLVLRGMGGSFFLPFALGHHGAPPRAGASSRRRVTSWRSGATSTRSTSSCRRARASSRRARATSSATSSPGSPSATSSRCRACAPPSSRSAPKARASSASSSTTRSSPSPTSGSPRTTSASPRLPRRSRASASPSTRDGSSGAYAFFSSSAAPAHASIPLSRLCTSLSTGSRSARAPARAYASSAAARSPAR